MADDEAVRDDKKRENASTHQCHVCGVPVCASLWQDHVQCAAHRACQTIAHTSHVRGQKMALEPPTVPTNVSGSPHTYPCHPCSVAVTLLEQSTHEHSEEHATSLLYGKLMESLASLYENRENLKTVCEDVFLAITDHETIYTYIQARLSPVRETHRSHEQNKNPEKEGKQQDEALPTTNSETEAPVLETKDPYTYIQARLSPVRGTHRSHEQNKNPEKEGKQQDEALPTTKSETEAPVLETKDPETENKEIIIKAESGAKLKVSFDNYHGYRVFKNKPLCYFCNVVVDTREEHSLLDTHKEKVQVSVKDKHAFRQFTDNLSHCVLCNNLVGLSNKRHITSDKHIAALRLALVQDDIISAENACTSEVLVENYIDTKKVLAEHYKDSEEVLAENYKDTVKSNERDYFCQVCQIYIKESTLIEHLDKDEHKDNMSSCRIKPIKAPAIERGFCKYCKVTVVGNAKENSHLRSKDHKFNEWLAEKDTALHYHFKESEYPNKVTCQICNVNVIDINHAIDRHVNSYDHQTNYKQLLKDNLMKVTSENCVLCVLCNLNLYMTGVVGHTENKCHMNKLLNCDLQGIGLKQKDSDDTKLKQILEENLINVSNEEYYSCNLCNRRIEKSVILAHIMSKKHTRMAEKRNITPKHAKRNNAAKEIKKTDSQKDVGKMEKEMIDFKMVAHFFKETNNSKELVCKLCNCPVGNGNEIIFLHVKGVKHIKNYDRFILENELKEFVEISSGLVQKYSCKRCRVDIIESDLFSHINNEKHKMLLSAKPSKSSKRIKTEKVKEIKASSLFDNTPHYEKYLCVVCNVDFTIDDDLWNLTKHADGAQHKYNLELLEYVMSKNQLAIKCGSAFSSEKSNKSDDIQITAKEPEPPNIIERHTESLPEIVEDISVTYPKIVNKILKKRNMTSCFMKQYCIVCNFPVKHKNTAKHVNSKSHKQNLRAWSNVKEIHDVFQSQFAILGFGQNRIAEANVVKEIITIIIAGTYLKLTEECNIDTFLKKGYCNICQMFIFPNNMSNFNDHVKEMQHEQNLQFLNLNSSAVNVLQNQTSVIPPHIVNNFCYICYSKFSPIEEHYKGTKHKVNIDILRERIEAIIKKDNMLEAVVDAFCDMTSVGYLFPDVDHICHICSVKVPNTVDAIIQHVEGINHIENVGLLKAFIKDIVDKLDVSKSYIFTNIDDNSFSGNVSKLCEMKSMKIEKNGEELVRPNSKISDRINDSNTDSYKTGQNDESIKHTSVDNFITIYGNNKSTENNAKKYITDIDSRDTEIDITWRNDDYENQIKTEGDDHDLDDDDSEDSVEGSYFEDTYACKVCDEWIPNDNADIKRHLDSFRHKDRVNEKYGKTEVWRTPWRRIFSRKKGQPQNVPVTKRYIRKMCPFVIPTQHKLSYVTVSRRDRQSVSNSLELFN